MKISEFATEGMDPTGRHLAALLTTGLARLTPCKADAAAASTVAFGREEEMSHGRKPEMRKGAASLCVCPAEGVLEAWEALAAVAAADPGASGGDDRSLQHATIAEAVTGQSSSLPPPFPLSDIKGRLAAWHRLVQVEEDLAAAAAIASSGAYARAEMDGTVKAVRGQMGELDDSSRRMVTLELDRCAREQDMEDSVMASRVFELKKLARELQRKLGGGGGSSFS
jgi:hypothetical protein